jgi:hypothetical protein
MKLLNIVLFAIILISLASCTSPVPSSTSTTTEATSTSPIAILSPPSVTSPTTTPPPSLSTTTTTSKPSYTIHGSLEISKGVPILRVWGSHYDMGYAAGYLCASKLEEFSKFCFDMLGLDPSNPTYEEIISRMKKYTIWDEKYVEEAKGAVEGVKASLGSLPVFKHERFESGSKELDADMFLFFNSLSNGDILNVQEGCSSFAAWGQATGDGKVRVGGNMEGPRSAAIAVYLLLVRQPDDGLATVSLATYGGFIGNIFKGMNEKGIVFANQGAYGLYSQVGKVTEAGYTNIIIREILEQVKSGPDMVKMIKEIFTNKKSIFSGTLLFAQKNYADNPEPDRMAVVVEKDASGFDFRLPSHNSLYNTPLNDAIFATNHFLLRQVPIVLPDNDDSVMRYSNMVKTVVERPVYSLVDMQRVLRSTNSEAAHSIYLEPDSLTIHIGYGTVEGPSSYLLNPVTFTWEELFAPIPD